MQDIHWPQSFENYLQALSQLESAVKLSKTRDLSELERAWDTKAGQQRKPAHAHGPVAKS